MLLLEGAIRALVIFFPHLAHKTAGKLDFGVAPALPAAMPTRAVFAEKSSTAASVDAAVSDTGAREIFPAPRPQDGTQDFSIESTSLAVACEDSPTPRSHDGTLDFGIAPALPAAVTARAVSAEQSSTAASFDDGIKGSDTVTRDFFP